MAIKDDDSVFEGLGRGVVNYSQVLMLHLDRICKTSAQPLYEDKKSEDAFKSSIKGLQSILSPYLDDEYEQEKIKLGVIGTIDQYFKLWSILTKQLKKANLLPAENANLYDNEDESGNLMA
jgi:hypothetical protein